jgi:hypothetical protein
MTKSTFAAIAALILAIGCLGCHSSESVAQTTPTVAPPPMQRSSDKPMESHQMHLAPGMRKPTQ